VARCYTTIGRYLAPDRLIERWKETFQEAESVLSIIRDIEQVLSSIPGDQEQKDLKRFLGMAYTHLGNREKALEQLEALQGSYSTLDVLNDAIRHYIYWAKHGFTPYIPAPTGPILADSPVIRLDDDSETRGDWTGRYGTYAYVLCGMDGYPLCGGRGWPLVLKPGTGDPAEPSRSYIAAWETKDSAALLNPLTGTRRWAYWDDRGEVYAYEGPDLLFEIIIPHGWFLFSLYGREHRVTLENEHGQLLAEAGRTDYDYPRYRRFVLRGPLQLKVRIYRGQGTSAILYGIFLNRLSLPLSPNEVFPFGDEINDPLLKEYLIWRSRLEQGGPTLDWVKRGRTLARSLERALTKPLPPDKQTLYAGLCWQVWEALGIWLRAEEVLSTYLKALTAAGNETLSKGHLLSLIRYTEAQGRLRCVRLLLYQLLAFANTPSEADEIVREIVAVEETLLLPPREELVEKVSDSRTQAWILYRFGMHYLATGQTEEAQRCFERAIQEAPDSIGAHLARDQRKWFREGALRKEDMP